MLTQVVLQTSNPMTFNIEEADPDEILVIKSISGLTPADVTLFTGDFARNGGYYQGRRTGKRNPVIVFKMNPDYEQDIEVSDIREMLYQQFYEPQAFSDGVQVLLRDDRKPDRYFVGYTEKYAGEIFDKSTEAQISLVCVDPFILSTEETTGSDAAGWTTLPLTYDGSADAGLDMTFLVKTATNSMTVDLNGQKMVLNKAFAVNDVIEINTVEGSRAIRQNGTDVMVALASGSDWIQLTEKDNIFKIYGTAEGDGKVVMTSYTFRSAWWGI
jgi:hypothetical protein